MMDILDHLEGKILMPVNQLIDMEAAYRKAGLDDDAKQIRDTWPGLFPSSPSK